MKPPSVIGIRAQWQCCACAATATTVTIAALGITGRPKLEPPPGWRVQLGRSYCGDHERRVVMMPLECAA